MRNYRKAAKSDGYIKNQRKRLKENRGYILFKISLVVVPLAILLIISAGIVLSIPSPEKGEQKEITFSNISRERIFFTGRRSSRTAYVLNTVQDGQFILPLSTKEIEELTQQLIPDKQYTIIYTENLFTKITKSLSYGDREFIKLKESVAKWEKEREELCVFTVIVLFLMTVGSILIYMFWCKKERHQMVKIKNKINERLYKKLINERGREMQTKIPVSKYWKRNAVFIASICGIVVLIFLGLAIAIGESEGYTILGLCCLVYIFSFSYMIFAMRRMMTDVLINDNEFQSMLANKKLAVVNKKQKVYYTVFEETEHVRPTTIKKYILISNIPFKYELKKSFWRKRILGIYNIRTQILIPCNSDTSQFFDLDNWVYVGTIGY